MISKQAPQDLAVFGGEAAYPAPLHVGRPNIGDRARFYKRVDSVLDRAWLTNNGPLVQELEAELAGFLEVPHCIAVSSGTVGLEILVRALGLSGSVLVPAFTFPATAHALHWMGVEPVFCDVDPETHNLDPAVLEDLVTEDVRAILGVHLWGRACAPHALSGLAERRGLRLIYDAAHAFGSRFDGRPIGGLGDAEVFSFHATKLFNTLEGGAITTHDGALAERLRLMRNFGYAGLDRIVSTGTNGKMNEISAAMGLTLLEDIEAILRASRATYRAYREGLVDLPGLNLLPLDPQSNSCQYIVVEVDAGRVGLDRDALVAILRAENVLARRYFTPGLHRVPPYDGRDHADLPVTERLADEVLVLPGGRLAGETVAGVCDLLAYVLGDAERIARRFAAGSAGV